MTEIEEEQKSLLMKVKEEREKSGLKLNIQKTNIMAFSPITTWQIDGETMTVAMQLKDTCFYSLSKESYDKLSVLKSRDITLLTKLYIVKAMVFPVVMYRCESWTINKAECQRIDAFKLWCWRRLLRVPWTARRPNWSILKEINLNTHWEH